MRSSWLFLTLLSSAWGRQETASDSKTRRELTRRIDSAVGNNDMVCLDGQRALVPNESLVSNFTSVNGAVSSTWGNLDLPSVLEINRFRSNTYFTNLAAGNLDVADTNYRNDNPFFYAPMAEDGDFRLETNFPMLAVSYANWDCVREDLTILVHAVPGSTISTESPLNTIVVGGVAFKPTEGDFIRDSDNSPIGFQLLTRMVGCDFCESIVIQASVIQQASVGSRLATTGQFPELDVALQCCPEPSGEPSSLPSRSPTRLPSRSPSKTPTKSPSNKPSKRPSARPSKTPSSKPSNLPSSTPSSFPSISSAPSSDPSAPPSNRPSVLPSVSPSVSVKPSAGPSVSVAPSVDPSARPSSLPSKHPFEGPTGPPSAIPTVSPAPIAHPTRFPTSRPSAKAQVCFPFRHPKFFPYRVEVWSGQTISRSDKNVCSPDTEKMYGYDPYKYHPYRPEPAYPFDPKSY